MSVESFSLPEDPSTRAALAGELGAILWLIDQPDALTVRGLQACWWRITAQPTIGACTGGLYELREQVEARLVVALVQASGMPATYWTDRAGSGVPDDASGLDDV
jgi:hypothetical protein